MSVISSAPGKLESINVGVECTLDVLSLIMISIPIWLASQGRRGTPVEPTVDDMEDLVDMMEVDRGRIPSSNGYKDSAGL